MHALLAGTDGDSLLEALAGFAALWLIGGYIGARLWGRLPGAPGKTSGA